MELDDLRRDVAEVDRTLVGAVVRRLELARRIGRAKRDTARPLRDYAVERAVLARWSGALAEHGIDPHRAEAFAEWLIEESLRVQEELRPSPASSPNGPLEVAVVGGAGAMGRWVGDFLEDAGHRVGIVDPSSGPPGRTVLADVETAARSADAVVFATPIRQTAPLLDRALATGTNALLFDILSVKAPIAPTLRAAGAAGRRVTSVHPMFGPSARTLSGRNLLIVSCGVPEADAAARALFAASALTISEVPLDDHDRLIAQSLGLSHAVNLLFLAALAEDPTSSQEIARAASTTFHRQSSLARAVASEGAELYLDIQALNPHTAEVYAGLASALERLRTTVGRADREGFQEMLAAGRAKLETRGEPMRR